MKRDMSKISKIYEHDCYYLAGFDTLGGCVPQIYEHMLWLTGLALLIPIEHRFDSRVERRSNFSD